MNYRHSTEVIGAPIRIREEQLPLVRPARSWNWVIAIRKERTVEMVNKCLAYDISGGERVYYSLTADPCGVKSYPAVRDC